MSAPIHPPGSTLTLPTSLVLYTWEKAYGQPFPQGPDSPFDWCERTAPCEITAEPFAITEFADACAALFGVDRHSAVLLATSLTVGVAGRTLLRPGSGADSIAWHVACIDGAGGNAARLCHELLRPAEDAVARILQQAGDVRDGQSMAQREFAAANTFERARLNLKRFNEEFAAGRKSLKPLPRVITDAEIVGDRRRLLREVARLELEVGHVRLLRRQQLFCGLIGDSEITDRREHGFDGALMEVVLGGKLAGRLASTRRQVLDVVRAWRDPAPVPRTLICHAGRIDSSPLLCSLWIAEAKDLRDVACSPRLSPLRILDPFVLIEALSGPASAPMPTNHWRAWCCALTGVFEDRLVDRRHLFAADDSANKVLARWHWFLADPLLSESLAANPALRRLPLQLAAVIRRLGDARHIVKHTITAQDAELAMAVAETAVKSTAAIRQGFQRAARHLPDEADVDKEEINQILVKLAKLGPSTLRPLTRSFHQMNKKELVARLDKAVAAGLVIKQPDGRFALNSPMADKCQRVSASAENIQ